MNCPFCHFPVLPSPSSHAARVASPLEYAAACGTCHAVFTVHIIVVSEPSPAWTANPERHTNSIAPATTYCAGCQVEIPLSEVGPGFCPACRQKIRAGLENIEKLEGLAGPI